MSFRGFLKADTVTDLVIGPVVAVGDGFTPVTNLVIGSADEAEIIKHNSQTVTDESGATLSAIANADGYYNFTATATCTDTEGRFTLLINDDSLCLPVRDDYMVVNANVFDSMYAAATTDYLQVDTLQLGGGTQSATDLKDFADAGYDPGTNKVQGVVLVDTTTTNSDLVTAAAIKTALEIDGGDFSSLMEALVNKMIITEANGNTELFNDAGASQGSVASAFTSVAGETIRLRIFK